MKKLLIVWVCSVIALPSFGGLGPKKLPRKPHAVKSMAATAKKARKVVLAKPTMPASDTEALANNVKKALSQAGDVEKAIPFSIGPKGKRGTPGPIEPIPAVANTNALFPKGAFEFYLLTLPNLFFRPAGSSSFILRTEQVEEADRFYKQFLKGRNIYGDFSGGNYYLNTLADSHIKWAEVLYAFTGLSLLGQPGAGDAIVDAALRAPIDRQLFNDYIALHALLLLEDWPALQRFINVRSAAGYGAFVDLREYLAHVVPDAPISFPKKIINEEFHPLHRVYHYPTVEESLQLTGRYGKSWERGWIEKFAHYIRGEKDDNYFLWNHFPLSSYVTGKHLQFEISEVASEYKRGKVFVESNLKYGAFIGLMDNFETYGIQEEDLLEKNNNAFLKCISYDAGITANMACIRAKLHRPIVYTPKQK